MSRKSFIVLIAFALTLLGIQLLLVGIAGAKKRTEKEAYAISAYDAYRAIDIWGNVKLYIGNYSDNNFGTFGKLEYAQQLGIATVMPGDEKRILPYLKPVPQLQNHFIEEFKKYLQVGIPAPKGIYKKINKIMEKARKQQVANGTYNPSFAAYRAQEAAIVKSLLGPNPGSFYMSIHVKGTSFPVLYEIQADVSTDQGLARLGNKSWVAFRDIGYITEQNPIGGIKAVITEALKHLGRKFSIIRSINK